jgi:hypothetical protein
MQKGITCAIRFDFTWGFKLVPVLWLWSLNPFSSDESWRGSVYIESIKQKLTSKSIAFLSGLLAVPGNKPLDTRLKASNIKSVKIRSNNGHSLLKRSPVI